MNLKFACFFCTLFGFFPCLKSYAGVLNEETKKKRLEFLAKGKHNYEFNLSLGHNISRVTYNTGLPAKLFTGTGEIVLYTPENPDTFYRLPTIATSGLIYSVNDFIGENGENVARIFADPGVDALLDLKKSLDVKFWGSVIPVRFDFNYIFNRRFKVGISEQVAFGFYYSLCSPNLGSLLFDYKADKKTKDDILIKRFIHTYLKKKLSIDYRTFINTAVRLFDYNPYSVWLNMQNGLAVKMGNKIFGDFIYLGYAGNLFLSLEKYLSKNTRMFFNFGMGLNVYHDGKHFDQEGKNKLTVFDFSPFNFSFGFSFGSNDGRYEDYIYQKAEYDFYIDKYQTTFDYHDEYFPVPEI